MWWFYGNWFVRDKESIVIRQEVDRTNITYFVVVDQAKDVTQVKVANDNPSQLKVVLMHIAWFKYVKKLKKTKNILLTNLSYTCSATSGKLLIDTIITKLLLYYFKLLMKYCSLEIIRCWKYFVDGTEPRKFLTWKFLSHELIYETNFSS